jgi:hypothetical protein
LQEDSDDSSEMDPKPKKLTKCNSRRRVAAREKKKVKSTKVQNLETKVEVLFS